jgi:2-octaprenylphenol hydroxylase
MHSFDVVVVGSGLVGAGFALALAGTDTTVAVVDAQGPLTEAPTADDWDSRIYAVSPGNADWLRGLGVWHRLPHERLQRVERMCIYGDRAPARLEFSAYDAGLRELAWIMESDALQRELHRELASADHVTFMSPVRCESIEWTRDAANLVLSDGRTLNARLIVGADGAESWVRAQMGVSASTHAYPQRGVVANFATTEPHSGTAFQWFRPDGVLALLPLPGKRVSMVWSALEHRARDLLDNSSADLAAEVTAASHHVLGRLSTITEAVAFPLRRQRIRHFVEPRAALIGDAAHNIHPLAGQGVNLGFRDARALASVLRDRGVRRDCGDYPLLRRYERARREDVAGLDLATDGLEKLFASPAVWMAGLRNTGLGAVDAMPALKNLLVRHAAA